MTRDDVPQGDAVGRARHAVLFALSDLRATRGERVYRKSTHVLERALGIGALPDVEELLWSGPSTSATDEVVDLAVSTALHGIPVERESSDRRALLLRTFEHYQALYSMAQPWRVPRPLVDWRGNLGSIDDDPPVDHFYSECRLSALGDRLVDHARRSVRLPVLLVVGVGGSHVVPAHSIACLASACKRILSAPGATIELGPPAVPVGTAEIADTEEYVATGRGELLARGNARVIPERHAILVDSFPWLVSKAAWIAGLGKKIREREISGIAMVTDESDRDGVAVIIELARGVDAERPLAMIRELLVAHYAIDVAHATGGALATPRELLDQCATERLRALGSHDAVLRELDVLTAET